MYHKSVFEFYDSLQDTKVHNFLNNLSGSDKDDLLKMLLELHTPIYAIDNRLHKLKKNRNMLVTPHPDIDEYVETLTERLDSIALKWFKEQSMIEQ